MTIRQFEQASLPHQNNENEDVGDPIARNETVANNDEDNESTPRHEVPKFLSGPARLDGNWGSLFDDGKSTYLDPYNPSIVHKDGFASVQGGHTPILFLQELAHLTSLMNGVALSTLRNDKEGVASPLTIYNPGEKWPEVDPKLDKYLYDSKIEETYYAFLHFLGQAYILALSPCLSLPMHTLIDCL